MPDGFDWSEGARVEIHQKQKWWEGEVVENAGDRVKLRYKDQPNKDEWLDKSSARLRPHHDDAGGSSGQQGGQDGEGTEGGGGGGGGRGGGGGEGQSSRPVRKSRLISDDAKLALQLQNEELKAAARYRPLSKLKASPAAPKSPEKKSPVNPTALPANASKAASSPAPASSPAASAAGAAPKAVVTNRLAPKRGGGSGGVRMQVGRGEVSSKRKGAAEGVGDVVSSPKSAKKQKASAAASASPKANSKLGAKPEPKLGGLKAAKGGKAPGSKPAPQSNKTQSDDVKIKHDPEGKVCFTLAPLDDLPPLSNGSYSSKTMDEDTTVMQIKRMVMDHVNKVGRSGHIEMVTFRISSGMQLGNDHSLKYIRRFLWPPDKGRLDIMYSRDVGGGFL